MDTKRAQSGGVDATKVLLTAIALMLGVLVMDRIDGRGVEGRGTPAMASSEQPESTGTLISAGEQRKQMIAELRVISQRMDALDRRLSKPLPVKVLEMPTQKEKPAPAGGQ